MVLAAVRGCLPADSISVCGGSISTAAPAFSGLLVSPMAHENETRKTKMHPSPLDSGQPGYNRRR